MHTITINDPKDGSTLERTYPAAWHEVTPEQLPAVALAIGAATDPVALKLAVLVALCDFPKDIVVRLQAEHFVEVNEHGAAVLPCMDWLLEPPRWDNPELGLPPTSRLPKVTIPGTGQVFIGPGDGIQNISCSQYVFASGALDRFGASRDEKDLDLFLACTHHPDGIGWDKKRVEGWVPVLAQLPMPVKLAAVLNWRGLCAHLPTVFPNVFDTKKEDGTPGTTLGLQGMMLDVAETGVLGDFYQVEAAAMLDVFSWIEHSAQKQALSDPRNQAVPEEAEA